MFKFSPWCADTIYSSAIKGYTNAGAQEIIKRVEKVAKDHDASMAQIALAWLMGKDGVTAPVIGTSSQANLKELLGAIHVKLTPEERKLLEEPYEAQGVFGH